MKVYAVDALTKKDWIILRLLLTCMDAGVRAATNDDFHKTFGYISDKYEIHVIKKAFSLIREEKSDEQ